MKRSFKKTVLGEGYRRTSLLNNARPNPLHLINKLSFFSVNKPKVALFPKPKNLPICATLAQNNPDDVWVVA